MRLFPRRRGAGDAGLTATGRRSFVATGLAALAILSLPLAPSPAQASDLSRRIDFLQVVPEDDRSPGLFRWSPGGKRLAFVQDRGDGKTIFLLDPGVDDPRRVPWPAALGTGKHPVVDGLHWSPAGTHLLVESAGDLFLLPTARDDSGARRLTETASEESDPKFAPDGKSLAFVRDADLHVLDLAGGEVTSLTHDGEANEILNGETDWVYWEEIWGRDSTGHWWSPDGRHIAYYRFEEEGVGLYPLVDPLPQYPEVKPQRYPKAGTRNPSVRIGVIPRQGGEPVWLRTGDSSASYLARVAWTPSGRVAVQRLNRDQTLLELLLCRPADGGACDLLWKEEWPTWVNLGNDLLFLPDGQFVLGSERTGWRVLYLHAADGRRLRRISPDGWAVTGLAPLAGTPSSEIRVSAFRTEPWGATDRHVLRIRLDGTHDVLTTEDGWHAVAAAGTAGGWVETFSDADTPTVWRVHRGNDTLQLHRLDPGLDAAELPRWEFLTIPGADGRPLPARLLRPPGGSGRRPVVMYHYGGPGSQVVVNRWSRRGRDIWHKLMAANGYVIFSLDNPASLFFGKSGEDLQHRRFGEVNLAAQEAGVAYLKTRPDVDPERIGLWGWSGGGTNTLYCLFGSPGTWRAGVAGAPVTDWHLYDSIWTERYLDTPQDNAEGYAASSPVTHAARLADALLVVHGTADDNVHPQNTLVLIDALVKAEVDFDDAIYPGQKHGFRGASARHFFRRMTRFFERELADHRPPSGTAGAGR